jgi:signal transduction histidine kinase/ActR/RegA family two-component response regulator
LLYIPFVLLLAGSLTHAQTIKSQPFASDLISAKEEAYRRPANAYALAQAYLEHAENPSDFNSIAYAKAIQAQALNRMGRSDEAYVIASHLLDEAEKRKISPRVQAELHYARGEAQSMQGTLAEAFMSYQKAHNIWNELGDTTNQASMIVSMAGLYVESGDIKRAIAFYESAVPEIEAAGDPYNRIRLMNNLAFAYSQDGQPERAMELLEQVINNEVTTSSPFITAYSYENFGEALVLTGRYEEAQTYLSNALGLAKELGIDSLVIACRTFLGEIAMRRGDFNLALDHAHAASSLAERVSEAPLMRDTYLLLSTIFRAMENFEASLAYMDKYIEAKNLVSNNEAKMRLELLEAQFKLSEKESEITLLQRNNELNALRLSQARTMQNMAISAFALLLSIILVLILSLRSKAKINRRLKQKATELMDAQEQLEKANKVKSDILAMTSHEIRTPLNAIMGMSQVLLRSQLDNELHRLVETIHSSGELLIATLNDILDLSKIEAGRLEIHESEFTVQDLADRISKLWQHKALEKGLEFRIDTHEAPNARFKGDFNRIQQIVFNLISNAIKFTNDGSVRVRFFSEFDGKASVSLGLQVIDTGIGIPTSLHDLVFEPFHQVESGSARSFGGTGLGLAICKQLAGLMNGKISLSSRPGVGTTFTLILPLQRAEDAEPQSDQLAQGKTQYMGSDTVRILVAEDNELNQMVIRHMLSVIDAELVFVPNGQKALQALEVKRFDLILMDLHMPIMDGASATRAIRALSGPKAEIPIIALTADAMEGDRQKVLDVGMDDYVSKPIDLETLLTAIQNQIDIKLVNDAKPQKLEAVS